MTQGKIFISHRAEYGSLVRELKNAIETTARGKIEVIISEELAGAEDWRVAIKQHLDDAEILFLVYGAPYEDWAWCFYEAGYFAGRGSAQSKARPIYCIARPNVDPPGPLSDLQMVTDNDRLIADLIEIYRSNRVAYDAVNLRQTITQASRGLFSKLGEFVSYPRVYFVANDADFGEHPELPASGELKGDSTLFKQLFAIGKDAIPWTDIAATGTHDRNRSPQELFFFAKWLEEMKTIILAARDNRFIPAQTVLVRGSMRVRFLLYIARRQADGQYSCEFLVIEEVGGPAIGVPQQQLALLTSVRLGFRFRYEFIKRFDADPADLSDEQRRAWTREIPQIIDRMVAESDSRGNITLEDLENAFDEDEEAKRIRTIVGYWPRLKENLYEALGLAPDGTLVSNQSLIGPNIDKYRLAFEALELINVEFLSRCCDRVARKRKRPEEELRRNADVIDKNVRALARMKAAPIVSPAPPAPCDRPDAGPAVVVPPRARDPLNPGSQAHGTFVGHDDVDASSGFAVPALATDFDSLGTDLTGLAQDR